MSLRRMFFAGLAQQTGGVTPPPLSPPEAYRQRVLADGGTIFSYQAVVDAYAKIAEWGIPADRSHWTSPLFGYRLEPGGVDKRYCLFGRDAINSGPTLWQLVPPSASGKTSQMNTQKAAFEFPGWTWPDKKLSIHVIATPTSFTNADGSYRFFPLVEQAIANNGTNFLMAFEQGQGFEGGTVSPSLSLATDNGNFPPLNQLQALTLRVDPAGATPVAQRRAWLSGRELTGQIQGTLGPGGYPTADVVLGQRFEQMAFSYMGYMNDVLVTNALLSDAARIWLDSQKNAY